MAENLKMLFNGTNGSTSYVTDDAAHRVCTFLSLFGGIFDSKLTTDQYYGSSGTSLNGVVTIPVTPFMNLGTGAFTIEFFVRTSNLDELLTIMEIQSAVNNYIRISFSAYQSMGLSGLRFEACTPTGGIVADYTWWVKYQNRTWQKLIITRTLDGRMHAALGVPTDYTPHFEPNNNSYIQLLTDGVGHVPITAATVMPTFTSPVVMQIGGYPNPETGTNAYYAWVDNFIINSDTTDVVPVPPIDPDPEDPTVPPTEDGGGDIYNPPPTGGDVPDSGGGTTSTTMYFNIGSTRPIQGAYFYLSKVNTDPNALVSGLVAKYFDGQFWRFLTSAHSYVDGTLGLTQNGKVSWVPPHTEDSSMPNFKTLEHQKYLEGYYLYWYHFKLPYGRATIAHVTLDIPFQNIIDTWDGNFQDIAACYLASNKKMDDATLKVLKFDDYLESDASSYLDFADPDIGKAYNFNPPSTAGECVIVGFPEKVTGLYISVPEKFSNIRTCQIRVDTYRDGGWFDEVNTISDGTSADGCSLSHSGVVNWKNMNDNLERKQSLYGSFPLYFYRLRWVNWNGSSYETGTLQYDNDGHKGVRITHISGIPVTNEVKGYSFSVHAADRLMLGCNNSMNMNELWISAQDRPEVFNGSDSQKIQFGNDKAIMCATNIYAQYASNIYNIILIFKEFETWILQWNQSSEGTSWSRFCISPNVGCAAPHTLCTASVSFENNVSQVKNIAIWRGHNGIYISNGQSPYCVSDDIAPIFDQNNPVHVDNTRTYAEYSWVDEDKMEYHWVCGCGVCSSYRNDKEFVLDLRKWKWFEIDRGYPTVAALNDIQCACTTTDIYGNKYNYGFNDNGYMERLEYGTDFDGTDITSIMRFGMIIPYDSVLLFSSVAMMNLICVPKIYDTTVTVSHYLDGYQVAGVDTGTDFILDMADSSHTVANVMQDVYSKPAIFHDFKFTQISDESNKGFEPLYFSLYTQKVREHTR